MKARTSNLSSDNLDAVLKASKNGLKKGSQQYWTPLPYAELLMLPLTRCRPAIADLQCGAGNLLKVAMNAETRTIMGSDIDPRCIVPQGIHGDSRKHRGVGSCVEMFDILNEAQVRFDLSLWNPPFSLKWPVESYGKTPLDSTMASFRMACDLMSPYGEALFICNAATADRLLADAPGVEKCWLWVTMPSFFKGVDPTMQVAVLYLANDHASGPYRHALADNDPANVRATMLEFHIQRSTYINGRTLSYPTSASYTVGDQFRACAEELERREKERAGKGGGHNIWLSDEGKIRTYLTSFQQKSTKVPRDLAERLATLDQRHPMELVVQADTRAALIQAVNGGIWRVHPDVTGTVTACVHEYNVSRAPFVPLNEVLRLGYLEEERFIVCKKDFSRAA